MSNLPRKFPPRDLVGLGVEGLWSTTPGCDFECVVLPDSPLELCLVLSEAHLRTLLFGSATQRFTFPPINCASELNHLEENIRDRYRQTEQWRQ
jgi:hypothetical protein